MSPERNVVQTIEPRAVNETFKEEDYKILRPSHELSWMLGLLSGAGYVAANGKIRLTSMRNPELLTEFRIVGQRLFGKEPQAGQPNVVCFFSKQIVQEIGDLRNDAWVETIQRRHRWVLDDKNLTWKFIEGIFDAKGHLRKNIAKNFVLFFMSTNFTNVDFIKKLLLSVGIRKPTTYPQEQPKESDIYTQYTISVYNIEDLKLIADNVHPKSPEKQKILKAIREKPDRPTDTGLYLEWKRLGKPSSYNIDKLKHEGETEFSREVYVRILGRGQISDRGSFTEAKKNLVKIDKGIESRDKRFQSEIGEDERQIWRYAVEHGLIKKMADAGMFTPQKLESIEIYCRTGIVPEDLTIGDFDQFTIGVANLVD